MISIDTLEKVNDIFSGLAVMLGLSAAGGVAAKALKQPPLVGYVTVGVLMGVTGLTGMLGTAGLAEIMGKIGVTLLLFLAGMELPVSELKRTGRTALITAGVQMATSFGIGYGLASLFGFNGTEAVYIGVGMSFGSTIMVVKLLSENGDIQSLHGKIAVGYLLIQDFMAIGILVVLSGAASGSMTAAGMAGLAVKGVLMTAAALFLADKVMGRAADYLARSGELLYITAIGWCMLVAAIVASPWMGFSIEIGGFLAGLTLANASEQAQIASRVRPLRDFFLTWFFVAMGSTVKPGGLGGVLPVALVLSAAVILVTFGTVYTVLILLGYHKRTAFLTGLSVAQISEFSLIIGVWGVQAGEIGDRVILVLTLMALVTMTMSGYLISNSRRLYKNWADRLWTGPRRGSSREATQGGRKMSGHVLLFGHNRTGSRIRPVLEKLRFEVMVVDFNPEVIEKLNDTGVHAVYGDLSDNELYEQLDMKDARMVISTVPEVYDNLHLLGGISKDRRNQTVIVTAADDYDAQRLYKAGADFVLVPNMVGGDFLAHLLEQHAKNWIGRASGNNLRKYLLSRQKGYGSDG